MNNNSIYRILQENWLSKMKPSTKRTYRLVWQDLLRTSKREVGDIDPTGVRRWELSMRSAGLCEKTIRGKLSVILSFYKFLLREQLILDAAGAWEALFSHYSRRRQRFDSSWTEAKIG